MFNNVVLDVAIGVVFIFLLYSLLATSIQEAIATGLSLRARTLKDGIINGMLCNTPDITRIESLVKGMVDFLKNIIHLVHQPAVKTKRLGHYFYDHPMIKNYGSSRIFSVPSYVTADNFSTVLIDILRDDFDRKLDAIVNAKLAGSAGQSKAQIRQQLQYSSDSVKIRELLNFYTDYYNNGQVATGIDPIIERDTLQILQMHIRNSFYNLEDFVKKIEVWYDDSMDRISGWYKRRVQFILFLIGIFIAVIFNVNIIKIAGKLSSDKNARDQMVEIAIKQAESYKDDPRVQPGAAAATMNAGISPKEARVLYDQAIQGARKVIDTSLVKPTQILALGWGDYGRSEDSVKYFKQQYLHLADSINHIKVPVTPSARKQSLIKAKAEALLAAHRQTAKSYSGIRGVLNSIGYVFSKSWDPGTIAGFLLTAMAICLGAPFWFDLLNKLVNIRATGKREENNNSSGATAGISPEQQPVTVNVGAQPGGEEAVG